MRQKKQPNWEEIKAAYVFGDATMLDIVHKYHITEDALRKRVQRGGWRELRDEETAARRAQVTTIVAKAEAERYARLLVVGDRLLERLTQAVEELDRQMVKRRKKTKRTLYENDENPKKATGEVIIDDEEIHVAMAPIDRVGAKALASALRDLCEIIRVGKGEDTDGEGVTVTFEGDAEGASG